jgi:hypothetical protein
MIALSSPAKYRQHGIAGDVPGTTVPALHPAERPSMLPLCRLLAAIGLGATAMAVDAPQPKIVTDAIVSAEWIAKALSSSGYRADFSLESLKDVDRFFEEQATDGRPKPGGLLSQQLGSRLFAIGAYVGEVIRRQAGGEWQGDDGDPQAEINVTVQLKTGAVFWPIQRVMKRLKNGPEDGIYAYGIALVRP